ncbi:primosomal protein N' [Rapidithrix thailandica]|uniref:Replication restart protein PriA n=1 Tax=Rapidithrix thailandica TaxID=413964 RepID=A0AAW9SD69_9BACT
MLLKDPNQVPESRTIKYVDVIIPVPIPKRYRYAIPKELEPYVHIGFRVVVQFGERRLLTAIVAEVLENPPEHYQAKYILDVLDFEPTVNATQLQLWKWIADYYMCTVGEVMNIAIPSGLKLTSTSKVQLNPEFNYFEHEMELNPHEDKLLNHLRGVNAVPYDQVSEILGIKSVYQVIKSLIKRRAIILFEEVKEKYKPKKIKKIRLRDAYLESEQAMEELFASLSKKTKQEEILLKYLSELPVLSRPELNREGLEKTEITHGGFSTSSLNTLLKNQIFEEFEVVQSRLDEMEESVTVEAYDFTLNDIQAGALDDILEIFKERDVCLLHGITGSGKTEVYIELVKKVLANGSQVLLMVPEIVLTAQMVVRLRKVFGESVGIYHSKFSDNERVEVWKGVAEGKFPFVVGVRSSLFLPFDNLGLVIVDEEHESSYKQYDPAPRYHARDMAVVLAKLHHAKVLLGSATPSVESYYLAKTQKYGLVELKQRYGNAQLPAIHFADIRKERKRKTMKSEFSSLLLDGIKESLNLNEQVILFQNRRGYAPFLTCEECAWTPKCNQCSVSLTYHMYRNELRCHYCGYREPAPKHCIACGSSKVKTVGVGTEKIEEELKVLLPETRIQRMDLDTTKRKYSYQKIISDFENQQIDILIGTQMVSKGLDFDHVSLVGVFDVDRMIHFPDFRSHERTFQLITQVSGRAGRREKLGKVIIQTANPNQLILQHVFNHDYWSFFKREVWERKQYLYPPFTRIVKLSVKSESRELTDHAAEQLAVYLRGRIGQKRVLGPEFPVIDKIRNQYLKDLIVKLERGKVDLVKAKTLIAEQIERLRQQKGFRKVYIVVDVDPA